MKKLKLIALLACLPLLAAASHLAQPLSILEPYALTIGTTPAYVTGDLIGAHGTKYLEFENAAQVLGGSGVIEGACLIDQGVSAAAVDLVLFSGVPSATTFTDNAALDISDTDTPKIIGVINFPSASYKAFADNSAVCLANIGVAYATPSTKSLYGALVARGTLTPAAATDLTLRLMVRRS